MWPLHRLRRSTTLHTSTFGPLLENNFNNLFNENSKANELQHGPLACGTVAKYGGLHTFSGKTEYDYHWYHMPLKKVERRSDVTYSPDVIARAAAAIKAKLKTGVPVLVGVVYNRCRRGCPEANSMSFMVAAIRCSSSAATTAAPNSSISIRIRSPRSCVMRAA
jgi:hypothetical protein